MSTVHGLACNGCGSAITYTRERGEQVPTKSILEQVARDMGWNAPDKLGRHWCMNCRGRKRKT